MSKVPADKDQGRVPDPLTQFVENPDGTDPGSLLREEPGIPAPGETIPPGEGGIAPGQTGAMEDPVEILVGMAERGEIDPWNINIMEVTDRFLEELDGAGSSTSGSPGGHCFLRQRSFA